MKSLKASFLCSIFGLRILAWAADGDPPPTNLDMLAGDGDEGWNNFLNGDSKRLNDHLKWLADEAAIDRMPIDDGDPLSTDADMLAENERNEWNKFFDDDFEGLADEAAIDPMPIDEKDGKDDNGDPPSTDAEEQEPSMNEEPLLKLLDYGILGHQWDDSKKSSAGEEGDEHLSGPLQSGPLDESLIFNVEDKGNGFFRWSPTEETGGCDRVKDGLDTGLRETETLSKNSIDNLDELYDYNRFMAPLKEDTSLTIVASAHMWGIYYKVKDGKYQANVRPIYKKVKRTYQAIWKNVTTERKPNDRLRLVCGDQGVEIVKEDNGKEYWVFKYFNLKIEKDAKDEPKLCHPKRNTSVFFGEDGKPLILFCDSVWEKYDVTLDSMIANERHTARRLDNMMTLGGVMMHVLMHALKFGEDVEIKKEEYQIPSYPSTGRDLTPDSLDSPLAWSYYWCVALARMDVLQPDKRESIINIQNYVWYATWVTAPWSWWVRSQLPKWQQTGIYRSPY